MAFSGEYRCTKCDKLEKQELLTAKKVMFQELGTRPRTFRSRIVHWLCPTCVTQDPEWNIPAYSSPGMVVPVPEQQAPSIDQIRPRPKPDTDILEIITSGDELGSSGERAVRA